MERRKIRDEADARACIAAATKRSRERYCSTTYRLATVESAPMSANIVRAKLADPRIRD